MFTEHTHPRLFDWKAIQCKQKERTSKQFYLQLHTLILINKLIKNSSSSFSFEQLSPTLLKLSMAVHLAPQAHQKLRRQTSYYKRPSHNQNQIIRFLRKGKQFLVCKQNYCHVLDLLVLT